MTDIPFKPEARIIYKYIRRFFPEFNQETSIIAADYVARQIVAGNVPVWFIHAFEKACKK